MLARIFVPVAVILFAAAYWHMAAGMRRMSLQEGFGPGFYPTLVAGLVIVIAALETLRAWREWRTSGQSVRLDVSPKALVSSDAACATALVVSVVVAVLMMPKIGFIASGAGLLFVLSLLMGLRPLWKSAVFSVVVAAALYAVFHMAFGVMFPR